MKKIGVIRLAWIVAGSVLGAGFVSGQELWQFFGKFGFWGGIGLVFSVTLFMVLSFVALRNANMTASAEANKALLPCKSSFLSAAVGILQVIFLLGLVTIMTAGAGALVNNVTGAQKWLMSLLTTILVVIIATAGFDGVASVFSFCVPLIAVASVTFAIISIFCFEGGAPYTHFEHNGKLLPNWFAAAVTYASYNIFASLGVLCPFGKNIFDKKTAFKGSALGALILLLISGSILFALSRRPDSINADMPMLNLAQTIGPIYGYIYGVLLFTGLLQTSVSCIVAAKTYIMAKIKFAVKESVVVTAIGAASFAFSLLGFGNLIGAVYPAFGYISALLIVCMLANYTRLKTYEKTNRNNNDGKTQ